MPRSSNIAMAYLASNFFPNSTNRGVAEGAQSHSAGTYVQDTERIRETYYERLRDGYALPANRLSLRVNRGF